jgi:hypothetical protein
MYEQLLALRVIRAPFDPTLPYTLQFAPTRWALLFADVFVPYLGIRGNVVG